jgi:hypothetical protein
MKSNSPEYGDPMPQEERPVWEEFCDDHELLERLEVTPQELTALKNCLLLGELTCKQDMLFILRQIRLATEPSSRETTISLAPDPRWDNKAEDSAKEISAPEISAAPANYRPPASVRSTPEPGSLAAISRPRVIERLGVLCWTLLLLGFVMWNLVTGLSNWRQIFLTTIGVQTQQAAAPDKR